MSKIIKQTLEKEDALARGRELVQKIKALLKKRQPPPSHQQVLKWDRNQPRGPKGSATGGQWVKGVSAGLGSMPGSMEPPAPGMEKGKGRADYADILNAPTGEGFGNQPRAANFEPPKPPAKESIASVLKEGSIKGSEPLGGGANTSLIVVFQYSTKDEPDGTKAVYKPEVGERWGSGFTNSDITNYITNKDFSLAEREAFASEAGDLLFGPDKNPVPETVLRESVPGVDIPESGGDDVIYDSYELREMYDEYREKAQEDAMDAVGGEMGDLFREAQQDHVKDIEKRAEEMAEIWNEAIKDYPEGPYGDRDVLRQHAPLPMGSQPGFERRDVLGALDPMEVLKDAEVDVTAAMSGEEKKRVTEIIRKKLAEGYEELGDVDKDKASEDLDYDKWMEDHQDTEARLYESKIKSLRSWAEERGYNQGSGGGGPQNPDAPHPNGGSLQRYVELNTYGSVDAESGARMAVLDYVIGTMDRHSSNMGWHRDAQEPAQPVAIDNGYSMPGGMSGEDDFTFRSVAVDSWLGTGKNVPEPLRQELHTRIANVDWNALVARHPDMNDEEREAFLGRVENAKIALQTQEGLRKLWRRQSLMGY